MLESPPADPGDWEGQSSFGCDDEKARFCQRLVQKLERKLFGAEVSLLASPPSGPELHGALTKLVCTNLLKHPQAAHSTRREASALTSSSSTLSSLVAPISISPSAAERWKKTPTHQTCSIRSLPLLRRSCSCRHSICPSACCAVL